MGSTPGLAMPPSLDIAQLAERLTVVDVFHDASDCYQLVTGSIPVVETRAPLLLNHFRVGGVAETKWRNGSASDSSPEGCGFDSRLGHASLASIPLCTGGHLSARIGPIGLGA